MSAVAFAMFAAGAYSAHQRYKGKYGNADERDRAARESLLTASWNIKQRNKESRQTQFETLDYGGNIIQKIAVAGKQAEGTAKVAGGSSGAVAESGSSRAALSAIVKQSLEAQTEVVLDTKHRIKAIARDTENMNISEWRSAKLHAKQQKRIASREIKTATNEFKADLLNSAVNAYAIGSRVKGSDTPEVTKTPDTTKKISTVKSKPTTSKTIKFKIPNQKTTPKRMNYNEAWLDVMKRKGRGYSWPK